MNKDHVNQYLFSYFLFIKVDLKSVLMLTAKTLPCLISGSFPFYYAENKEKLGNMAF